MHGRNPVSEAGRPRLATTTRTANATTAATVPASVTVAANASSATFTVTTPLDNVDANDGQLSLREAITAANANPGADTIVVPAGISRLALAGADNTNAAGDLDVSGSTLFQGAGADATIIDGQQLDRVFDVHGSAPSSIRVVLQGLTVRNGNVTGDGGGIRFGNADLVTRDCLVSGNRASANGGGIANTALPGTGIIKVVRTTVARNVAGAVSGGLDVRGSSVLTAIDSTIRRNLASGSGGGGGIIAITATLTNCTVSGNSVGYSGGGLFDYGTATLTNCTVSGNQAYEGGGVYNFGTARLINTIVARNWGGDLEGSLAAASSNNLIGGDPLLAPLGNYGGAGQTMPLLPGSPAIDAGTSGADIPTTDQRGSGRVGAIDIGAFESQGFNFKVVPGGTPQTANIGTAFAHPLAVSVSANNPVEPVDGGRVSFVAHPAANGATAIIVSSTPVIAGRPVAVTAVPNNVLGSYTVVARAGGDSSATFTLTNTGTPFAALVVNTTSDALTPGAGLLSLREAIAFSNTSPSGNSPITFDSGYGHLFYTPQTITLTGAQFELSNTSGTATIIGPTVSVTVSGGGLSRVFQVDELVTASIYGMTITGAFSGYDSGGGLNNLGTTTLTNCTVSGNTAYYGGGLANFGTATLIHCTVGGNSAIAFNRGGGVSNFGTATLTDCTVSGNLAVTDGGGLLNLGSATLTSCTISGNHGGRGGGLRNSGTATLNVTSSTIANNQATSQGGGISTTSGSVILTNSVISSNQVNSSGIALGGGIDCENSKLSLTNCTVSANLTNGTTALGGGIYSFNSSVILRYCVITANQANGSVLGEGGGIYSFNSDLNLLTSIVIGNKATTDFDDIFVGP
jgi:CSLREA domain-containing protein